MKGYTIRSPKLTDVPKLVHLLNLLKYKKTEKDVRRDYKEFFSIKGYDGRVLCYNDEIVGGIAWSKAKLMLSDINRFHIEALVIIPEHRGKGLGRGLLACVEDIAKQCKPSIIDLTSGLRLGSEISDEFYNSLGYEHQGELKKLFLE